MFVFEYINDKKSIYIYMYIIYIYIFKRSGNTIKDDVECV